MSSVSFASSPSRPLRGWTAQRSCPSRRHAAARRRARAPVRRDVVCCRPFLCGLLPLCAGRTQAPCDRPQCRAVATPVTDVATHLLAHRDPTSRLRYRAISAATARAACHLPTTPLVMPGRRHGEARGLTLSGEKKRADEGWNRGGERTAKSCGIEVAHLQVAGGLPIRPRSRGTRPMPASKSYALMLRLGGAALAR